MRQARQGDIYIELVKQVPEEARLVGQSRFVLARGEATCHCHVVEGDVEVYETADTAERWLRVGAGGATVVHDEHGPIPLEPGIYREWPQREYDPLEYSRPAMEQRRNRKASRPRVTVDVDPELRRRLRLAAAAGEHSVGAYVREAIQEKLERDAEDLADLEYSLAALKDRPGIRSYAEFLAELEAGRVSD